MRLKGIMVVACLAVATVLISQNKDDLLWQYRNRGKAFYESPAMQMQAVAEFKKALDLRPKSSRERLNYGLALLRAGKTSEALAELQRVQTEDPKLPHTWFNLGIQAKKAGETEEAIRQFEQLVRLVPDDAVSHYNLGSLYKLMDRQPEALEKFRKASDLAPHLAAPHFQLFNAYRLSGQVEEAKKQLAQFQELKKAQELSGISEDMEWNDFAEIYDPVDPSVSSADAATPLKLTARTLVGKVGEHGGLLVFNFDGDAKPDLLVWSEAGGLLYRAGATPVAVDWGRGRNFAAGDIDNDGFPELCMITGGGAELLSNRKGVFDKAAKPLASGSFVKAIFIDFDHDYDLDLMLLGPKPKLLRNQGEAGLVEVAFPFVQGHPVDAISFRVVADSKAHDLVITYQDRPSVLYRDRLAGRFDVTAIDAVPIGATGLRAADWNHDGQFDLAFLADGKLRLLANQRVMWTEQEAPSIAAGGFAIEDLSNRGVSEIVAGDSIHPLSGAPRKADALKPGKVIGTADFNLDGRLDIAVVGTGITIYDNATPIRNRWFTAKLSGVKNRKLAAGAEVEVRSGRQYQKKVYEGYPLLFGLGGAADIDTVRITWPNGLIQNEPRQPVNRIVEYRESQRLSGSCPMIFTWNGREFEFQTDVLGVAPLGASSGDGSYFPTDHDEYVWIPGGSLRERDGTFDLRITEELSEVTYLDQLKLIAVDHPASVELFSNDKWKSSPFPEFRLFGTSQRIYARRAVDGKGNDVTAALRKRDRVYADRFTRRLDNTAETHSLVLDFGPDAPSQGAFLVLNGWVDWADGSTFLKQAQEPGGALAPPYLQVRDGRGEWKTVIEDMGIPSGKTKTIAVDLSGRFLSSSREVRIVTNLCLFWDEAFLGVERRKPAMRMTELAMGSAELRFHGFSKAVIHPERRQPEFFHYEPVTLTSMWNPTPGNYTRFGDVHPLLAGVDDQFVIMGSGDEVALRFNAAAPKVPQGWQRDYLLFVDGWAKDSDANTAYSQTVEPLPFHAMRAYPYGARERYPDDTDHRAYRSQFNTRPATRLLRSLVR